MADFPVNPVLAPAIVREHAAVEFFRSDPRLAPEEIKHAGGAARDRLVGEQTDDPRTHERIDLLPVDVAGLLFDHPETAIVPRRLDTGLLQRPEHVHATGVFGRFALDRGIAVHTDEIQDGGHVEMVKASGELSQIVRDGNPGCQFVQQIGLHFDEGDDGIAGKPHPLEEQGGIIDGWRQHRHRHIFEAGHDLRPEAGAHQIVQTLDRFVFRFQPGVPVTPRLLVEGPFGIVTAEAVVDLPGD